MQLRNARLCLDCEEVHESQQCPLCASETFVFVTRWVPAPERRQKPRSSAPPPSPEVDTYRELLNPQDSAGWRSSAWPAWSSGTGTNGRTTLITADRHAATTRTTRETRTTRGTRIGGNGFPWTLSPAA